MWRSTSQPTSPPVGRRMPQSTHSSTMDQRQRNRYTREQVNSTTTLKRPQSTSPVRCLTTLLRTTSSIAYPVTGAKLCPSTKAWLSTGAKFDFLFRRITPLWPVWSFGLNTNADACRRGIATVLVFITWAILNPVRKSLSTIKPSNGWSSARKTQAELAWPSGALRWTHEAHTFWNTVRDSRIPHSRGVEPFRCIGMRGSTSQARNRPHSRAMSRCPCRFRSRAAWKWATKCKFMRDPRAPCFRKRTCYRARRAFSLPVDTSKVHTTLESIAFISSRHPKRPNERKHFQSFAFQPAAKVSVSTYEN